MKDTVASIRNAENYRIALDIRISSMADRRQAMPNAGR